MDMMCGLEIAEEINTLEDTSSTMLTKTRHTGISPTMKWESMISQQSLIILSSKQAKRKLRTLDIHKDALKYYSECP